MKKVIAGLTAVGMLAFATPAFADMNSSNVSFTASNTGAIINVTGASADTGGNTAGGSKGGSGGEGGDVEADDGSYNNGGADAGNGGNGGNASAGGLVHTGDASADAGSINSANTNDVKIGGGHDDCGCDDMNSSYIGGNLDNEGVIVDITVAGANTGDNDARGSRGGRGGEGGEVESDDDGSYNNGGANAGNGGNGGAGGLGGEVDTGDATSNAGSINVLNTNIIRVRH
ncbi:MAG: hypothetical protein AAB964_01960 [Patescibacteria group bacterium]